VRIRDQLDLEGASVACPLWLEDCFVEDAILLRDGLAAALSFHGCHLRDGLSAQQLETRGDLDLTGVWVEGELVMYGAHVEGQLLLSGARLVNDGGVALNANNITVDSDVFCREGFNAKGEVRLLGAHIGGQLDFSGARLASPGGYALLADRLTVENDMFCRDGFDATGEVSLRGAHIGGQLTLRGASLVNLYLKGQTLDPALDLEGLTANELILQPKVRPLAIVDLTNAKVGSVADSETTWPEVLRLRGFIYDRVWAEPEIGASARLPWLERDPRGYAPQVYDQLAAAYRADGRDEDALRVLVAKQRQRRSTLNPAGKVWNSLLRWTVGYGYRPYYALFWLVALWVVGWIVFSVAHPGDMTPTADGGPQFYAVAYSLDTLLPIVDLGQQSHWTPGGAALVVSWVLIGLGWVLTTAVVAALTGLIKRE
jgi:hypothetical protein